MCRPVFTRYDESVSEGAASARSYVEKMDDGINGYIED
jgi:hypothetical protein